MFISVTTGRFLPYSKDCIQTC